MSKPLKVSLLAVSIVSSLWLSASCGSTRACGPGSCDGCCDAEGECHAGSGLRECGSGGAMCTACPVDQVCRAGACVLFDDAGYDGSFEPDPDGGTGSDAGVFDAGRPDSGMPDAGQPDAGRLPDGGVSFSLHVQRVFNDHCVSCHGGAGGLNLGAGSYARLVNVASGCDSMVMRVSPSDAGGSQLWRKTKPSNPCSGTPMPRNTAGLGVTDPDDFDILETWIAQGAPNN